MELDCDCCPNFHSIRTHQILSSRYASNSQLTRVGIGFEFHWVRRQHLQLVVGVNIEDDVSSSLGKATVRGKAPQVLLSLVLWVRLKLRGHLNERLQVRGIRTVSVVSRYAVFVGADAASLLVTFNIVRVVPQHLTTGHSSWWAVFSCHVPLEIGLGRKCLRRTANHRAREYLPRLVLRVFHRCGVFVFLPRPRKIERPMRMQC